MTHIKTRYDTSGTWTAENPVLMEGERGEESNTGKAKVGDGTTPWNSLGYSSEPFANAALTGVPTAPTATGGTNTTQIATTQFVQTELAGKAGTASPAFSGTPTAPTPPAADNDTSIATTAFVQGEIATALAAAVAASILAAHPIGSIYMTVNPANPSGIFGGTWSAWGSGRVPVGVSADTEFNTVEETGGSKTHALTTAELASHQHTIAHDHETNFTDSTSSPNSQYYVRGGASGAGVNANLVGPSTIANSGSAGSGDPHNNLQPYITCYMWKRTA